MPKPSLGLQMGRKEKLNLIGKDISTTLLRMTNFLGIVWSVGEELMNVQIYSANAHIRSYIYNAHFVVDSAAMMSLHKIYKGGI